VVFGLVRGKFLFSDRGVKYYRFCGTDLFGVGSVCFDEGYI
jgi:hypothetical protein